MDQDEQFPCAEKMSFDSERQALDTALTSKHWYGSHLQAYKCTYCGLWHLATKNDEWKNEQV